MGTHCQEKYEKWLGEMFGKYGKFASNHTFKILLISIFVNVILGLGLLKLETENNLITLYTPRDSQALQDQEKLEKLYVDRSGDSFYSKGLTDSGLYGEIIIRTKDSSNILRNNTMEEVYNIDKLVQSMLVSDSTNTPLSYKDICAINDNGCVIDGGIVLSSEFRTQNMANNISWPTFMKTPLQNLFGKVRYSNNRLIFSSVLKLRYYLLQNTEINKTISRNWEKQFIEKMGKIDTNLTDVAYTYSDSLSTALQSSTQGDIKFFSVTFTLMMIYASIATIATGNGFNCVADRQNLGRSGVLPSALAVLSTFGILCLSGVKFTSIVGVMPFLVLGIGIDDMFVLLSGMADTLGNPKYKTAEDKIVRTMQTSGVAITITSLTDGLAFAVGATSVFNSVRNFCAYTGLAVLICYINQLTIFVPFMVLNEKRMKSNRHPVTCKVVKTREESKIEKRSKCYILCCTGDIPNTRKDVESILEIYPKIIFKKSLHPPISVICIALLFLGYLSASVYGVLNLKQGLQLSDLALKDSDYYKHISWYQEYYSNEILISFTITAPQNYNSNTTYILIKNLIQTAQSDKDVVSNFSINWLDSFYQTYPPPIPNSNIFIQNLHLFLDSFPEFTTDVVVNDAKNIITSSRFYVLTKDLKTSTEQGELMLRMRQIADNSGLTCTAFAPAFIYYEQYVVILKSTLQTVGVAVAVMFVITVLFMPSVVMVILVTITLVSILLGVFGFMYYWDLTLSSITMIHLVMSVGFAVDFSAHICHAYLSAEGSTRREKVDNAIDLAGGPIFNAAVSSIIGVLMLVASSSYIFRSFFKVMLLVVAFGLTHAVLILPHILYLIGPLKRVVLESGPRNAELQGVENKAMAKEKTIESKHV